MKPIYNFAVEKNRPADHTVPGLQTEKHSQDY